MPLSVPALRRPGRDFTALFPGAERSNQGWRMAPEGFGYQKEDQQQHLEFQGVES